MTEEARLTPPGPSERHDPSEDLLQWLGAQFARHGDTFRGSVYNTSMYGVNDVDSIQHVLRTHWKNYRKGFAIKRIGLLLGNGIIVSEGELWKSQRKMIQPAFHHTAIDALTARISRISEALCDRWLAVAKGGGTVNVTRDTSHAALAFILEAIFGDDYDEVAPPFSLLSEEAARDLKFATEFKPLRQVVAQVAERRRARNVAANDMLGVLLAARNATTGAAMSPLQVVNEAITLVVAGHETAATTLNWAWWLISQHPAVEARLHAEADQAAGTLSLSDLARYPYAGQVVEEAMRLYPAVWLLTKRAVADDHIGPFFVPAGTEIYISPYHLQRHPALWDARDRFDPDRFAPEHARRRPQLAMLPFSAGPRNCIGDQLARVEMQIHLVTIARRLRLRYVGDQPPELDPGVNLRTRRPIIMRPEDRRADWSADSARPLAAASF